MMYIMELFRFMGVWRLKRVITCKALMWVKVCKSTKHSALVNKILYRRVCYKCQWAVNQMLHVSCTFWSDSLKITFWICHVLGQYLLLPVLFQFRLDYFYLESTTIRLQQCCSVVFDNCCEINSNPGTLLWIVQHINMYMVHLRVFLFIFFF